MNEKEILEYRKRSAERLGGKVISEPSAETVIVFINEIMYVWSPDSDANQMLMVWELWGKEGIYIEFENYGDGWKTDLSPEGELNFRLPEWSGVDSDIKLATAKAFLEYDKQQ